MKNQPEYNLQKQVCTWLTVQYPEILFMTDTVAMVRLTMPQQSRNKAVQKHGFHCPDLIIFEKRGDYGALFLELKAESPYKKNGELRASEHLTGQQKTINQLRAKGYCAQFAWSFDMCRKIVESYLSLPKNQM